MCPPCWELAARSAEFGLGAARSEQGDGCPAVAGDDRAVGSEAVAERFELFWGRVWFELPGEGVALADAEVVDGPDVEAAELEHQVHLGGPAADAAYADKRSDQFLLAPSGRLGEDDCSVEGFCREIGQGGALGRGQTRGADGPG